MAGKVTRLRAAETKRRTVELHGRSVSFIEAGSGPVLLLVHGMAGTCANWESVIEPLAIDRTVIPLTSPATVPRPPAAATTRWVRWRAACAT
jgi:hypothetical protein